jgi:hypothetical protein
MITRAHARPYPESIHHSSSSLAPSARSSPLPPSGRQYFKTLDDIGSVEDFWGWMTEVTPQYLYQHNWYNGTAFGPDFRGTKWRVLQVI